MIAPDSHPPPDESIEAIAARWIARRDRGLSESEQGAYEQWLREDPRHESAMVRPEKNWSALDQLAGQFSAQGRLPDPDLLAPPRRRSLWFWTPLLAAAAAVLALVYFGRFPASAQKTMDSSISARKGDRQAINHVVRERLTLEDGSIVELNARAKVNVQFTTAERRVQLERGEAYFIVVKNPERPFIVSANRVKVRAVGTAFSVGLGPETLSVLVTEGRVRVDEGLGPTDEKSSTPRELAALIAGQQGVINLAAARSTAERPEMKVLGLTPAEIDQALSWRSLQLEFTDLALGEVVTEFNRYNRQKLVVADAETAAIHVGGIFRADNVDAFVSLLDTGFGVSASAQGGVIILRKAHGH